jgi:hypothetical protein
MMIFSAVSNVTAQMLENVAIHGFGGWAYGRTDNENRYLAGNRDGSYDELNFSLNISAKPYERLSLHVQPAYNERREQDEAGLDYAFAEWTFSDRFKLRFGKVKAPFMLYTETYDVGTIRPFFFLPQGVYQEIAAEAYKGIGVTGLVLNKGGWELLYDLYGGKLSLLPKRYVDLQRFELESVTPIVHDMLGGRLTLRTPFDGFTLALSAYSGDTDFRTGLVDLSDHYTGIGISAEYFSDHWWFRSEYFLQQESSKIGIDVVYGEIAYTVTEHLQTTVRYEFADFEIPEIEALYPESFLKHQELVLGLNYWLNPNFALKLSYHIVDGNRFASPDRLEDFLMGIQQGAFDKHTNLIVIGAQFSF